MLRTSNTSGTSDTYDVSKNLASLKAFPARGEGKWLLFVGLFFCLSRIVYGLFGVVFIDSTLSSYWQYVDPQLLRDDLARSLFYLHSQPPLFNLYLGCVLKTFPNCTNAAFHMTYLGWGLVLCLSLYGNMRGLGVAPLMGACLTALFMGAPPCVLYENWLFYTYPTTALLSVSALALQAFLRRPTIARTFVFLLLLSCVGCVRSLFHVVWFVAILAVLLLSRKARARLVLLAAVLPFALLMMVYAKNRVVFGQMSASTWAGMNLARVSTFQLPLEERQNLVRNGNLSNLAMLYPFQPLAAYAPLLPPTRATGIPVLDQPVKSTGAPNYNHIAYIEVSQAYMYDARWVIRNHPAAYRRGIANAYDAFFSPLVPRHFLSQNLNVLTVDRLNHLHSLLLGGGLLPGANKALFLLLGYLVAVVSGLVMAGFDRTYLGSEARTTLLFLVGNIVYVAVVGTAMEVGENARFRFMVDPLCIPILALLIQRCCWWFFGARHRGTAGSSHVNLQEPRAT